MKRGRAELALALVTVIWGTTFVVVKSALDDISPLFFITLRFTLATLILVLIYRNSLKRSALGPGLLAGGLLFLAYTSQTVGLATTTPSKSAFLTSLSIPMVPLAGSLVYRTRPRFFEGVGIVIASVGMILMTLPPGLLSGKLNRSPLLNSNWAKSNLPESEPDGSVIKIIPTEAITIPTPSKKRGLVR